MSKRRGLLLVLGLILFVQFASAVNVIGIEYNATKGLISVENADSMYSYEINFNYSGTSTIQQYSFLGTDSAATYGTTVRDGITSVYGSRLDSGLTGINGNGALFNGTHEVTSNLTILYAYFIQNDSAGIYAYYNETPSISVSVPANTSYGYTSILFNVSMVENGHSALTTPIGGVWFSLDGGITNFTMNGTGGTEFTYNYTNLSDGESYSAKFYGEDSYGNKNFSSIVSFRISIVASPTCSDSIQNGDETGTDCGGSCSACPTTPSGGGGGGGGVSSTTYTLEADTMARGYSKALKSGDAYRVRIDTGANVTSYLITLLGINSSGVRLRIGDTRILILNYGNATNLDLDGDGLNDILLNASSVIGATEIYVQQLSVTTSGTGAVSVIKESPGKQTTNKPIISKDNSSGNVVVAILRNVFEWLAKLFKLI